MTDPEQQQASALIFGARNLGKAIIELLVGEGWSVAGVARSEETLQGITDAGALALQRRRHRPGQRARGGRADRRARTAASIWSSTPHRPTAARAAVRSAAGRWPRPTPTRLTPGRPRPRARRSASSPAPPAISSQHGRATATLIQVTGGSARRAMPGRGLWAAGAFGVRAITQAAAQELRPQGIHVALLIVDAGIEPLSGPARGGASREALADPRALAEAVLYLAEQGPRAATHELQVTPLAETWVP